jgi:hypothetical protein
MNTHLIVDILGWVGTVLFLAAYMPVPLKKAEGMNIAAGILQVINTFYRRAYPSFTLNADWIVIGLTPLERKPRSR